MIRIRYVSQLGLPGQTLHYSWAGRMLTATLNRSVNGQEEVVGQEIYDLSILQPED